MVDSFRLSQIRVLSQASNPKQEADVMPGFVLLCSEGEMHNLAVRIIDRLNALRPNEPDLKLSHINYSNWRDGELNDKIPKFKDLNGKHVVFFMASHSAELVLQGLQIIGAIKYQYAAAKLTVVMPFMAYRRQDHSEKPKEINRNLWFLRNLQQNGVDNLIVCDAHSEQTMMNGASVGLEMINVDPTSAFVAALSELVTTAKELNQAVRVFAPDKGSLERAVKLAKPLAVPVLFKPKERLANGQVNIHVQLKPEVLELVENLQADSGVQIIWQDYEVALKDALVIIRDDELDTGRTAALNARWCLSLGAGQIIFAVTHTCCSPGWREEVAEPDESPFKLILAGNTIYRPYRNTTGGLINNVDMSKVLAEALARVMART